MASENEGLFRRLARLWQTKRLASARAAAIASVEKCRSPHFEPTGSTPLCEGPMTVTDLRYARQHPAEFFMCSACVGSGPWHQSWTESRHRLRALGACCTGAD